jgi:hypothetical protein
MPEFAEWLASTQAGEDRGRTLRLGRRTAVDLRIMGLGARQRMTA